MPDILTNPKATLAKLSPLRMFSTLVHKPEGVCFAEQKDDEEVILFLRRDFITNVPWLVLTVFFASIPLFLPYLFAISNISLSFLSTQALLILNLFYYFVVFGFALMKFITWFYGMGIVTNKRAVDIDLYNVSYINVAATEIEALKNIHYNQRGFFQSLFDYGDVIMAIEASGEKLTFEQVPEPARVVTIMSNLITGKPYAN